MIRSWDGATAVLLCSMFAGSLPAAPNNPDTDWFQAARYGVFVHYLEAVGVFRSEGDGDGASAEVILDRANLQEATRAHLPRLAFSSGHTST